MIKATQAAIDLINKHRLSVPINIDLLIKKLNIELKVTPLDSMSGFAYRKDGKQVIGINETDGEDRKRFTKAHELGHMLLHADTDVLFDKKNDFVYFRDASSSTGLESREVEANAFAAELLMPAQGLKDRITKLGGVDLIADDKKVKSLAKEYKVSFTAMSVRIDSLTRL